MHREFETGSVQTGVESFSSFNCMQFVALVLEAKEENKARESKQIKRRQVRCHNPGPVLGTE